MGIYEISTAYSRWEFSCFHTQQTPSQIGATLTPRNSHKKNTLFFLRKIHSKNKRKKGLLCGFLFRPLGFHIRDLVGLDAALRWSRRLRVFPFHQKSVELTHINTVPAHNAAEPVECPDLLSPLNGDRL